MKKFYAEQAFWGCATTVAVEFNSLKERNEYVRCTDYTNKISAKEARTKETYKLNKDGKLEIVV